MDIKKKKVLLVGLENTLTNGGSVTEFCIRREILDKIRLTNISRVFILYDDCEDKDFMSKRKAIEFFVFCYCKIAVRSIRRSETLLEDIKAMLPHNQSHKDIVLCVGENVKGIDCLSIEDFTK